MRGRPSVAQKHRGGGIGRRHRLTLIGLKVNSLQFDLPLPSNSVSKVVEIHPYRGGGKKRIENLQPADLFRA